VLLVADSLRYDAVFGGHEHLLPYAVGHGVNFAQARSAGCWTLPATATLFTGLLPHAHGATSQSRAIRPQVPTLAERMRALGYTPYMVSANIATTEVFGLHRGFERVECAWKRIPARFKRLHALLVLAGKPRLRRKLLSLDMIAGKLSDDLDAAKVWLQSTLEVVFGRARSILREAQQQNRRT
jgi:Sulfatase